MQRHAVGLDNLPTSVDGCAAAGHWIHHHDAFGMDVLTVFVGDSLDIQNTEIRYTVPEVSHGFYSSQLDP